MEGLAPKASKKEYDACWDSFLKYHGGTCDMTEDAFGTYLNHLRTDKAYQASTLWKIFSMLNNVYQRQTGQKLQKEFPRLMILLKSFNDGYTRKVSRTFSLQDICNFLVRPTGDKPSFWKLRKCVAVCGFVGGMRCAEIKSLQVKDLRIEEGKGVWITFVPKKQRKELKKKTFLVPANQDDPSKCMAAHILAYLADLRKSLGKTVSGDLFHTVKKSGSGYTKSPMGINYIYAMPKEIATYLELENPEIYTGHAFRRSVQPKLLIVEPIPWSSDGTFFGRMTLLPTNT